MPGVKKVPSPATQKSDLEIITTNHIFNQSLLQVQFDPRRGFPLTVWGVDEAACERVWAEVQRRIVRNKNKDSRKASSMTVLHELGDNQKAILTSSPYGGNRPYITSDRHHHSGKVVRIFHLARIESSGQGLESLMAGLNLNQKVNRAGWRWRRFSEKELLETVQKNLDLAETNRVKRNTLEFNISPGKLSFTSIAPEATHSRLLELTPDQDGVIAQSQLKEAGLLSIFNPLLHPSLTERIIQGLKKDGFECLNLDTPDQLTIVHLLAGESRDHITVNLALDRELQELEEEADPRLDDEKRRAVEKVFQAKTIGEVLSGNEKPTILYKKISLLVHPDKNSHPGATEAFKKVQHAFEKIKEGNCKIFPALEITSVKRDVISKPPKVMSVRTKKKKISNITFFSGQILDLRASLTAYDEDSEGGFFNAQFVSRMFGCSSLT